MPVENQHMLAGFRSNGHCADVSAVGLSDPEAKEKYLLSLMESMPEPNHSTVVYLIDHLIR